MSQTLITIRRARPADAERIAHVHDESWREAYRGIIPGQELERLIARRGPDWWLKAIQRGSRLLVLEFDAKIAGYVSYGRNRFAAIPYAGEIFELYLAPAFQGLGFGRRMFKAARDDLVESGYFSCVVWALADNEPALRFYEKLGGEAAWRAEERFGKEALARIAFGFPAQ